jgi:hypothetical protein
MVNGNRASESGSYYSVHAMGFQTNFILPTKSLLFFFKYYNEYSARPDLRAVFRLRLPDVEIPKPAKQP